MMPRGALSILLFLSVAAAYLCNGRTIGSGDTIPASYLPWSLLRERNFDLDEFPSLYAEQARATFPLLEGIPYYLRQRADHYLSAYSPGPALLALPVYGTALLAGVDPTSTTTAQLGKLTAALITAASVVLFFWTARIVTTERWALTTAFVYAFGTSSLSVSSQALWQHGASQFFVTLSLYWLVCGLKDERKLPYAGFAMSSAVVMRSTNLLLVFPAALWVLSARRHVALRFTLLAFPPLAGRVLYNLLHFGTPFGAWGNTTAPAWAFFVQTPLREGITGVLASPSRGLFVYSPVLLFSFLGMASAWRSGPAVMKALALGPFLVVVVVGKWFVWWGGHSWGPRLLADVTPILCFFLHPVGRHLDRRVALKVAFLILAAFSVGTHALGAFFYDGRWDRVADVEHHPSRLQTWGDGPLAFYGRQAARGLWARLPFAPKGPTSADSPALLSAALTPVTMGSEVFAAERFDVSLLATNTGRALWLAGAPGGRGAVQLGWRWYAQGRESSAGWERLPANVPPGETVRFDAQITAPPVAGEYELVLDLVSHWITWFADRGSTPIRIPIRVRPLDPAEILRTPSLADGPQATVEIATDRTSYHRDDTLRLTVELSNPHSPGRFDAHLILEARDGTVAAYDGHDDLGTVAGGTMPWVRNLPLPARATGRFSISLSKLEPDDYRWHLLLMETNPRGVVARAAADFSLAR